MEKTLRDEFAMSMPYEFIPELQLKGLEDFIKGECRDLDLDKLEDNARLFARYEAKVRYIYADEMLKESRK